MWMDHGKNDETHIDNHLPSSQTSAKMHHAGSISIWTLAHRSLHPHLEVWYLEIELKIPILSMEKSLPRMNDNPLYLICVEFSKCSGWLSHRCNLLHLMGPKLYIPLGTKGLGINMICMSLMLQHSHWHLYKFVDFQRDPLKSHSFIAQNQVSFKDLIIPYMSDGSPIGKGLRSASHWGENIENQRRDY